MVAAHKKIADRFKMLSDATRITIMAFLKAKPASNVKSICGEVKQSQPATSHHLALLRNSGLIDYRRDGKNNFYSLTKSGADVSDLITKV
jgi:ArsR family transcriptional regulator